MKFYVCFECDSHTKPVHNLPQVKVGLNHVKAAISHHLAVVNVHAILDAVDCTKWHRDEVEVSAEQAINCHNRFDVFGESSTEKVEVPENFLNQYYEMKPVEKRFSDGIKIQLKWVRDSERILADWIDAGCPKRWGFDATENEEEE